MEGTMSESGARLTGLQVLAALVLIVAATVVVPPATAWTLHTGRVERTRARLIELRETIRPWLTEATRPAVGCGTGRLPDRRPSAARARPGALTLHQAWLADATMDAALQRLTQPDGWGRCLLVARPTADPDGPVWLLSAGANGLIETDPGASVTAGDDLGVRFR